jgi:hypothetical protein
VAEQLPAKDLTAAAPHLRRPFAPEAIKFRPAGGGLVLAYIDARVVIERLNAVVPELWSTRFEPYPGGKQIICHLTIDGITRSDVGSQSSGPNVDPVKGGYSDALKRAAVHFGIGVSVYALKQIRQSDLPAGSLRDAGKTKVLTEKGEASLRNGYKKWLGTAAGKHFGKELGHGDVEGSVGDPEAAPSGVGGEPVEAPSLELESHRARVQAAYDALSVPQRKGLSKAKFQAQLTAASGSEADLAKLEAEIEGRAK